MRIKKLISDLFRKDVYLYDAKTLTLISKYNSHKDLIKELKISSKTIVKFKDSGMVYKDQYIISSKSPEEITGRNSRILRYNFFFGAVGKIIPPSCYYLWQRLSETQYIFLFVFN